MAKEYTKLSAESIIVNRSERQRRVVGTVQDLSDSIKRIGLINPITITRDNVLIAGERRLEACKLISPDFKIHCRYLDELDPIELQLLELEENLKRSELNWQDQVKAVANLHKILSAKDPEWTQEKTADYLGFTQSYVAERLSVAANLSDAKISKASDISTAKNIIKREATRAVDNEINSMLQVVEPETKAKTKSKIFNEDFIKWSESYSGAKYNLIHCDFPYGIDHQKSEQGNIQGGAFEGYSDSEDVYWKLCSALCTATPRLALPSAHLMFWFSMKFYSRTIKFIEENSDWELVTEHPLIWLKSDNKGIVSDVTRRPRNIYETALIFSRGDRKIITPISNAYACPTSKSFHASEKPEPMLRHFFRMFVDDYSEVLDPTCGSGTAIRAAFSLGAKRSIGLELNPEFAKSADGELTRIKAMKQLEKDIEV
jgi:ParB-like chromosome segregation protein Spo0J